MFNIHAYTNKSTFDIRKKLNLLLVKKEKEKQTNNITVYILRTISLFIGNNHFTLISQYLKKNDIILRINNKDSNKFSFPKINLNVIFTFPFLS